MKKLLTMVSLLLSLMTSAQGTWEKVVREADELKGQKESTAFIYTDETVGSFIFWDGEVKFRLVSTHEQFHFDSAYNRFSGTYYFATILVGFYDNNGNLVDKFDMNLDLEDNSANRFLMADTSRIGHKKKINRIFEALRSDSGYVRIVASRYQSTDFDLKIIPNKE